MEEDEEDEEDEGILVYSRMVQKGLKGGWRIGVRLSFRSKAILISSRKSRISYTHSKHW